MTTSDTSLAAALGSGQFARLTTFRKSGAPVATAIWFAEHDGKVVFLTGPKTGKAKRMRRNPLVGLAASSARGQIKGPEVRGTARLLGGAEADEAHGCLAAKYGIQLRLLQLVQLITRATPVYYEVSLA
jgi:PPOX class probable F420-dependent enzyme